MADPNMQHPKPCSSSDPSGNLIDPPAFMSGKEASPALSQYMNEVYTKSGETCQQILKDVKEKKKKHGDQQDTGKPKKAKKHQKPSQIALPSAARAFNATTMELLSRMSELFPEDKIMPQLIQGLEKHMGENATKDINVPAILFWNQVNNTAKLPDGREETIATLIQRKDEILVEAAYRMDILNMLSFNDKFKKLNKNNREYVWQTLTLMMQFAATVVVTASSKTGAAFDNFVEAGLASTTKLKPTSSIHDVTSRFSKDKNIVRATRQFVEANLDIEDDNPEKEKIVNEGVQALQEHMKKELQKKQALQQTAPSSNDSLRASATKDRMRKKLEEKRRKAAGQTQSAAPEQSEASKKTITESFF